MSLSWNLDQLYPGFDSKEYQQDKNLVQNRILNHQSYVYSKASIQSLQNEILSLSKTEEILQGLYTYCMTTISINTKDEAGKVEHASAKSLYASYNAVLIECKFFVSKLNENDWNSLFQNENLTSMRFYFENFKKNKMQFMDTKSEKLISKLNQYGPEAFGNLYNEVSNKIEIQLDFIPDRKMSKSEVFNYQFHHNASYRKESWKKIQLAMEANKEIFCAILNSIYGQRVEVAKLRSEWNETTNENNFLNKSLREAKISKKTLSAMMKAIESHQPWLRETLMTMGNALNKGKLNPWDLLAPAPMKDGSIIEIDAALNLIRDSFSKWTDDFSIFLDEILSKNLIDSNVTSTRTGGAYQCYFVPKKLPMVFLTYDGSFANVNTLAHELGHAYHSYQQKDLNIFELDNPNTLAETASVFAEFCLNDYLLQKSSQADEKKKSLWESASRAIAFLVNIPARFEFEMLAHQKREKASLSPNDYCNLTKQAWEKWYGDTLNEYETYFWAQKMHFSFTAREFYNYPYAFGYLFSACLFAELKRQGPSFMKTYKEILKNTGKMTAEDLVEKYLGKNIAEPAFWHEGLNLIKNQMVEFREFWK